MDQDSNLVGHLLDETGFLRLRTTDAALEEVLESGLFTLIEQQTFDYYSQADSPAAFDEWVDVQWETSYLPEKTRQKVKKLLEHPGAIAIMHRAARISLLRPITLSSD